jgi:hypothetical protein
MARSITPHTTRIVHFIIAFVWMAFGSVVASLITDPGPYLAQPAIAVAVCVIGSYSTALLLGLDAE